MFSLFWYHKARKWTVEIGTAVNYAISTYPDADFVSFLQIQYHVCCVHFISGICRTYPHAAYLHEIVIKSNKQLLSLAAYDSTRYMIHSISRCGENTCSWIIAILYICNNFVKLDSCIFATCCLSVRTAENAGVVSLFRHWHFASVIILWIMWLKQWIWVSCRYIFLNCFVISIV